MSLLGKWIDFFFFLIRLLKQEMTNVLLSSLIQLLLYFSHTLGRRCNFNTHNCHN